MKKITQKDVDKAWKKARDKAQEAWDEARKAAWKLERKFKEQEGLK